MKLNAFIVSAAILTAGTAYAQSSSVSVEDQLSGMGYSNIQVEQNGNTVTVEGYRDGQKREVSFNSATGEITSDRTRSDSDGDRVNASSSNAHSLNDDDNDGNDDGHDNDGNDSDGNDGGHDSDGNDSDGDDGGHDSDGNDSDGDDD